MIVFLVRTANASPCISTVKYENAEFTACEHPNLAATALVREFYIGILVLRCSH